MSWGIEAAQVVKYTTGVRYPVMATRFTPRNNSVWGRPTVCNDEGMGGFNRPQRIRRFHVKRFENVDEADRVLFTASWIRISGKQTVANLLSPPSP